MAQLAQNRFDASLAPEFGFVLIWHSPLCNTKNQPVTAYECKSVHQENRGNLGSPQECACAPETEASSWYAHELRLLARELSPPDSVLRIRGTIVVSMPDTILPIAK
jgi:hypothetical protein